MFSFEICAAPVFAITFVMNMGTYNSQPNKTTKNWKSYKELHNYMMGAIKREQTLIEYAFH